MQLEQVIFAIDNDANTHTVAKFMRHVDTLRAMGRIDTVNCLIGCYKGRLERAYMMRADQFHEVSEYVQGQETILRVPGDSRQPCVLEHLNQAGVHPEGVVVLGPMSEVSAIEALASEAWTYEQNSGKYFICL